MEIRGVKVAREGVGAILFKFALEAEGARARFCHSTLLFRIVKLLLSMNKRKLLIEQICTYNYRDTHPGDGSQPITYLAARPSANSISYSLADWDSGAGIGNADTSHSLCHAAERRVSSFSSSFSVVAVVVGLNQ